VFAFEDARDRYLGAAPGHVEAEMDRREDRLQHLRDDQREDVEQRAFRRVLAGQDAEQRRALVRGGALVDDRLDGAVAFVQRAREIDSHEKAQPVEPHIPEMAVENVHAKETLAFAMSRSRVEIARAAEGAVAVLDPLAAEPPIRLWHKGSSPSEFDAANHSFVARRL